MDKFPVCWQGKAVGELEAQKELLNTSFLLRATLPEMGLWGVWLIGEQGELRLGMLEPGEDCVGIIRRRFSDRMVAPLGILLRGELRPVKPEQSGWEPVLKPEALFRTRRLSEEILKEPSTLTKQGASGRWIAFPYDKGKCFHLVDLFCFAELARINGREYLVFCFDRKEQIIFGEYRPCSGCQHLEKN